MKPTHFVILIFVFYFLVHAQDLQMVSRGEHVEYKNNIGFCSGYITGYGVSYRKLYHNKMWYKITCFPYYFEKNYDKDADPRTSGFLSKGNGSFGFTVEKYLAQENDIRVFSYMGTNLLIDYEKSDYIDEEIPCYYHKFTKKITVGAGLGGELQAWRILFNVGIGVRSYIILDTNEKGILPSIECSGYFAY